MKARKEVRVSDKTEFHQLNNFYNFRTEFASTRYGQLSNSVRSILNLSKKQIRLSRAEYLTRNAHRFAPCRRVVNHPCGILFFIASMIDIEHVALMFIILEFLRIVFRYKLPGNRTHLLYNTINIFHERNYYFFRIISGNRFLPFATDSVLPFALK